MGKEHLCLGRGSRQQAAPKWWLKLHPALRVRVRVRVCTGGLQGMISSSSWSEELLE